jgi:hypothetical protein
MRNIYCAHKKKNYMRNIFCAHKKTKIKGAVYIFENIVILIILQIIIL